LFAKPDIKTQYSIAALPLHAVYGVRWCTASRTVSF